jgi:hypothetical protein
MDEYLELLAFSREEAKAGRSLAVFNKDTDHAAELVASLIDSAETNVDILAGQIDPRVYESQAVLGAAKRLIERGQVQVRIALDGRSFPETQLEMEQLRIKISAHKFLDCLKSGNMASLKFVPADVSEKFGYHFLLVDNQRFRFEKDWKVREAIAYFLNLDSSKILSSRFDEIWSLSVPF